MRKPSPDDTLVIDETFNSEWVKHHIAEMCKQIIEKTDDFPTEKYFHVLTPDLNETVFGDSEQYHEGYGYRTFETAEEWTDEAQLLTQNSLRSRATGADGEPIPLHVTVEQQVQSEEGTTMWLICDTGKIGFGQVQIHRTKLNK